MHGKGNDTDARRVVAPFADISRYRRLGKSVQGCLQHKAPRFDDPKVLARHVVHWKLPIRQGTARGKQFAQRVLREIGRKAAGLLERSRVVHSVQICKEAGVGMDHVHAANRLSMLYNKLFHAFGTVCHHAPAQETALRHTNARTKGAGKSPLFVWSGGGRSAALW